MLDCCVIAALVLTENEKPPDAFNLFCVLKMTGYYQGEETECESLSYKFLFHGNTVYIYSRKHLLAVPAPGMMSTNPSFSPSMGKNI